MGIGESDGPIPKREYLENLRFGDVIVYQRKGDVYHTYLVVKEVINDTIYGNMATPIAINTISINNLLSSNLMFLKKAKLEDI